jgi:hypothetical protein
MLLARHVLLLPRKRFWIFTTTIGDEMAKRIASDHLRLAGREMLSTTTKGMADTAIQTTVGDLIAALVEEVEPYATTQNEINVLVGYILMDLCRDRRRRLQHIKTADLSVAAAPH